MRYIVKLMNGKTLCNVSEYERAKNICNCYPDSYVTNLSGRVLYWNNDSPF